MDQGVHTETRRRLKLYSLAKGIQDMIKRRRRKRMTSTPKGVIFHILAEEREIDKIYNLVM